MSLRAGIVGFGAVAEMGHLPVWRQTPGVDIVVVADPSKERRERAHELLPDARVYEDVRGLTAIENIDFIDVASTPVAHEEAIAAALSRGIHVLCEKPVLTTAAAIQRLGPELAATKSVIFPVHNWKQSEAFRSASEVIASGALGKVRHVHIHVLRDGWSVSADDWRAQRAVSGGGILIDHGWHAFYLAMAFAPGEPRQVRASTNRVRYTDADVEDTARCKIEFDEAVVEIDLTWAGSERRTAWEIVGDNGRWSLCDDDLRVEIGESSQELKLDSSLSQGSHHPEWFAGVIGDFFREIHDADKRGHGLREALQCLAILDAAYRSAETGQTVEITPITLGDAT